LPCRPCSFASMTLPSRGKIFFPVAIPGAGSFYGLVERPGRAGGERRDGEMGRKPVRRRRGCMLLPLLCCAAVVGGALFVPWLLRPENLRSEKDRLRAFLFGT